MIRKRYACALVFALMCCTIACKKEENVDNTTNSNVISDDEYISSDNPNVDTSTSKLVDDIESITDEVDNSTSVHYSSDVDEEVSVSIDYELEKLTFGDWGFEVSVPKHLVSDYTLIDSVSSLNFQNADELEKTYAISSDDSFQLFNLDDKYFGIFVDKELVNENWEKATKDGLFDYIEQVVPNNSFYTYSNGGISQETISYGDNVTLVKMPVVISPTSSDEIAFEGGIIYLTIDDVVYYILYGENKIYDSTMKEHGYTSFVLSSVSPLEEVVQGNTNDENVEEVDDGVDHDYLQYIEDKEMPHLPTPLAPAN